MAGIWSPSVKMGSFLAWAEVWVPPPPTLTLPFLQWALLVLLGERLYASLSFQYFFSGYICYVIKELAKKKISHP